MGRTCYPRNIWRGHDHTRFVAEEVLNSEPEHERSNLSGYGLGLCFAPPKKMRSVLQDKGIKHFRLRNPIRKLKRKEEGGRGRLGDRPPVSIKEGGRDVFQSSSQELAKIKKKKENSCCPLEPFSLGHLTIGQKVLGPALVC